MLSKKENLKRIYAHEAYEWFPQGEDMISVYLPIERYFPEPGESTVGQDWFGTYWQAMPGELGGSTVLPGRTRLESIEDWEKEQVLPGKDRFEAFDWQGYFEKCCAGKDYREHFVRVVIQSGPFERLHMLLGFEEALCALYEEPEEVKAFVDAMVAFKKMEIDYVAKYLHPDVVSFHDDYGTEKQLFMSPEMWREFFAPAVRTLVEYMHEKGLHVQFHSCGYIMDIVGELVDAGVDALEIQSINDLRKIKNLYGEKVVLVSGIDEQIEKAKGRTDGEIQKMAEELYPELMKGFGFFPSYMPESLL